ncbi:MAG: alpha/beta fold hydrolase, partial [Sphingomonadaceae bacterium]
MSVAGSRLGGDSLDLPVAGGQVRVEVLGEGPALVLLHGWTLDRRVWMPQRVLADRLRLVAPDRRGFGQSSAPPDLAREPDDVLALADALGIGRFVVAGQSQGGRVALHLALRAPERVAGVLLLGSALDGLEGTAPEPPVPLAAMRAALEAGDAEAMRRLWAAHPFLAVREPATRRLVAAMVADYAGRDLLAAAGSLPVTAEDLRGLVP